MKITPKILSIPPYISTNWNQIRVLYMKETNLVICLTNGASVSIPDLNKEEIETIFHAHSAFTESLLAKQETPEEQPIQFLQKTPNSKSTPSHPGQIEDLAAMHLNFDSMESFNSTLHHNPDQANMPPLPEEVIKKIAAIAKIIAPGEIQNMPKPEPHCNCPHCQITRAIHHQTEDPIKLDTLNQKHEEIIDENDLTFQQWEISQIGDKLYSVTNRLDFQEKYSVYLGDPVGCTCGTSGCEHILAVLKS